MAKPRKNPLTRYKKTDTKIISFPCGSLEAETHGIIDDYGYLYIGKEFAGKRGRGLVERDNIIKDDLSSQKDNS